MILVVCRKFYAFLIASVMNVCVTFWYHFLKCVLMHFKSVWPQFQILIMSPSAFTRLIKTRRNNTKHLVVSKYHNKSQMTFGMSRKHRLWKHAKETLLADMHSQVLSLCGSIKYKRWRWAKRASLNHKETRVKGEYESKHILTCIERLCANMVVVSFLCMVLLNDYQSGLRVEDWKKKRKEGRIEIGTNPIRPNLLYFTRMSS